jgi:hypothetical protein
MKRDPRGNRGLAPGSGVAIGDPGSRDFHRGANRITLHVATT